MIIRVAMCRTEEGRICPFFIQRDKGVCVCQHPMGYRMGKGVVDLFKACPLKGDMCSVVWWAQEARFEGVYRGQEEQAVRDITNELV
jgi:hypothetical protein